MADKPAGLRQGKGIFNVKKHAKNFSLVSILLALNKFNPFSTNVSLLFPRFSGGMEGGNWLKIG